MHSTKISDNVSDVWSST